MLQCFRVMMSELTTDFYASTCPDVLTIVRDEVKKAIKNEQRMAASLIRLHFADCFVSGCDGSVLLDGEKSEKSAAPNLNLRGFDVVDKIKSSLESKCAGIVSCADILAIAARYSVLFAGGNSYKPPLGRSDGVDSDSMAANRSIPSAYDSLDAIINKFELVRLNLTDVVLLSGAHSIGRASCPSFSKRLYNFKETGAPDPTMNSALQSTLQKTCDPGNSSNPNNLTPLDHGSVDWFDKHYYNNLLNGYGVLGSDQQLYSGGNAITKGLVEAYSKDQNRFYNDFANSMIKMG